MVDTDANDDRVLELRRQGQSFGTIAKTLGLDRAQDAHDAFHRALRRRPAAEQTVLRDQEVVRLDTLSRRLQSRPHLTDEKLAAQLRVVRRLRDQLVEGASPRRAKACRTETRGMTAR